MCLVTMCVVASIIPQSNKKTSLILPRMTNCQGDADTDLYAKDVMSDATQFGIPEHIAVQIQMVILE